jgi:hypothetical protein
MGMEKTIQMIWSALTEKGKEGKESTDIIPRLQARALTGRRSRKARWKIL